MIRFNAEAGASFNGSSSAGDALRSKKRFRFGRFELDVHARELRKDGVRLRLQDQPFVVLTMLLQQPGEVITREALCRQLWPDGTFVDFEHGLNAAVKRLRNALGDSADEPRFVETLHRRGYRFVAQVDAGQPLRAASLDAGDASAAHAIAQEAITEPSARKPRLAVLPFFDLDGRDPHSYFTEGLTEEMITELGRVCASRLGVVARASSMLVQREGIAARQIGEALRADFLVEGGVRRDGERVRITVRLIETRGETQLWANSYDRQMSDWFAVQSDVAARVVHSLAMELLPEPRTPRGVGTRHVRAQQSYLIGRYHWNQAGASGLGEAAAYFQRAIRFDPEFAAAHAALARAHVAAASYYLRPPREALEEAREAAAAALALDPADSDAHLSLAEVRKSLDWDPVGAEEQYRVAVACNPSNEAAQRLYGVFLAAHGRGREATLAVDRAGDLDPLCLVVNTSAAWVRYLTGDYAEAIERCQHTLDMDRRFVTARRQLAAALLGLGKIDEAIAELEGAANPLRDPTSLAWLAHAVALKGDAHRATEIIGQLRQVSAEQYVSRFQIALALTGIGDLDGAFGALSDACDARDPAVVDLAVEPRFEPLRADRRYRELIDRLGVAVEAQ